jgi:hypothetical protein
MLHVFHAKCHSRLPKVRVQKAVVSSQSTGGVASSLIARKTSKRSKSLRRLLCSKTTQQRAILQVSWLNYFICYWALSNIFKTNSLYCNMYSKWCSIKEFRCRSSNLSHHYLTSGRLLEFRYVFYHYSLSVPSFSCSLINVGFSCTRLRSLAAKRRRPQRDLISFLLYVMHVLQCMWCTMW